VYYPEKILVLLLANRYQSQCLISDSDESSLCNVSQRFAGLCDHREISQFVEEIRVSLA
jgi:hypothetical protein